jgi:hypothetical protein
MSEAIGTRWLGWMPALIGLAACSAAIPMREAESVPAEAPPGKAIVFFHRPSSYGGAALLDLWDGEDFVGRLQGKESTFWVCEPGAHAFIAKLARADLVAADLEAGEVYDVVCDVVEGLWSAEVRMTALVSGHVRRADVAQWLEESRIVVRDDPAAADVAQREIGEIREVLAEFTTGEERDRVQRLARDDHR